MRAQSESQFFALSGVGHDKKFRSSLFKGLQVQGGALVALRRERNLFPVKNQESKQFPKEFARTLLRGSHLEKARSMRVFFNNREDSIFDLRSQWDYAVAARR